MQRTEQQRENARRFLTTALATPDNPMTWAAYFIYNGKRHPKDPEYVPTERDKLIAARSRKFDIDAEMAKYPAAEFQSFGPAGPNPQFPTRQTAERLAALAGFEILAVNVPKTRPEDGPPPPQFWFAWADKRIKAIGSNAVQYNQDRVFYRHNMEAWNMNTGELNRAFKPVDPDTLVPVHLILSSL